VVWRPSFFSTSGRVVYSISSALGSITVDISGLTPPIIWRLISSAYRAGYSEIMITGIGSGKNTVYSAFSYNTIEYLKENWKNSISTFDMSPMETVSAVVNRLVGMEIIEQKPNYCLVKDLSEVSDREFENALRRIFALLQTEAENIEEGLAGKAEGLKSIHIVDTNLGRFEDFCFRVLNKKGYTTLRKTNTVHPLIFTLEMIGDEMKKIALHILNDKGRYTEMTKALFNTQKLQMERFQKMFYKFDKQLAVEIYRADAEGTQQATKFYKKLNDDEKELLHHMKKIGIYILSPVELRIDMEF